MPWRETASAVLLPAWTTYMSKPITSAAILAVVERWMPLEEELPAPIDPERMSELRGLLAGDETTEFLAALESGVNEQLQQIALALSEGDLRKAGEAAHWILNRARRSWVRAP